MKPIATVVLVLLCAAPLPAEAGHGTPTVQTMDADGLKQLYDTRAPVVSIDLRPLAKYRKGHLPGARSIPIGEIRDRFREIPWMMLVVFYCDCSIMEVTPVYQSLRQHGYRRLFVLEGGVAAWTARGYPLER